MTNLALLLNATGREVLLENCHYNKLGPGEKMPVGALPDPRGIGRILPYWKSNISGGELVCPEHLFRTSGDIRNSWSSWFSNLQSTTLFQQLDHPISQPGCWAYADMLMVGVFGSDWAPRAGAAASVHEWRSHFGAWCIVSSPLILSFDLANSTVMEQVWPFIANPEAIAVNQQWAGHPGRQVFMNSTLQIWTKPTHTGNAVLVINMGRPGTPAIDVTLDLKTISALLPSGASARDVWNHKSLGNAVDGQFVVRGLASHDSSFLMFSPPLAPPPAPPLAPPATNPKDTFD